MSEFVLPSQEETDGLELRMAGVLAVSEHYDTFDVYRRTFGASLRYDLLHKGPLHGFIAGTLEARPDMGSSQAVHQVLRGVQHDSYGRDPAYPYDTEEQWRAAVDDIFKDPERLAAFTHDVRERELQSNIPDRYRGLKAFMGLAQACGRLSVNDVLDVGCSRNLGLKYLASGKSFSRTDIFWPNLAPSERFPDLHSAYHTAAFQELINDGVSLGPSIGVDLQDLSESGDWARACSFYPHELLDEGKVTLYDELDAADYETVDFYKGNFALLDDADFREKHGRQYDIVHLSTMLYQAPPVQRAQMIVRAMEYAREFVVVQDFACVDKHSGIGLSFLDNWQGVSYPYRTVVLDMKESEHEQRWHEVFQWTDGRVRAMKFNTGRIISGHSGEPVSLWTPLHRRAFEIATAEVSHRKD